MYIFLSFPTFHFYIQNQLLKCAKTRCCFSIFFILAPQQVAPDIRAKKKRIGFEIQVKFLSNCRKKESVKIQLASTVEPCELKIACASSKYRIAQDGRKTRNFAHSKIWWKELSAVIVPVNVCPACKESWRGSDGHLEKARSEKCGKSQKAENIVEEGYCYRVCRNVHHGILASHVDTELHELEGDSTKAEFHLRAKDRIKQDASTWEVLPI